MSAVQVPPAFKKLVIRLGHMFYSGQCPPAWWVDAAEPKKADNPAEAEMAMFEEKKASQLAREAKRKAQQDTTGLGIVLLTTLVEKQWVEEDELARSLNLPAKMVRRAMRFFEQEQLVQREHKKETKRVRRKEKEMLLQAGLRESRTGAADAAAGAAQGLPEEEEEEVPGKGHTISYCSLDYPRIVDSVRWRMAIVQKNLQKEIRGGNTLQQYKCPNPACGKEYSSMDVFDLMDPRGPRKGQLLCSICNTEIEMVLDEGGRELGTMEDRRERIRKARVMLEGFGAAMQPLTELLNAITDLTPPDFNTYNAWLLQEVDQKRRLEAIEREKNAPSGKPGAPQSQSAFTNNTRVVLSFGDSSSSGPSGSGATAVALPAAAAAGPAGRGAGSAGGAGANKTLPPWLASKMAQQTAAKPIPPWLASNMKQQQQQHGTSNTLQQQGLGLGGPKLDGELSGLKADGDLMGLKPDPGFKEEEMKIDPEFKQEGVLSGAASMEHDDDWEAVPGGGEGGAGGGGGHGHAAAVPGGGGDDAEDEEWEDV